MMANAASQNSVATGLQLTFERSYRSLVGFRTIELPQFVMVTGLNGCGKTQLLNAIKRDDIKALVDGRPVRGAELFDATTLLSIPDTEFESRRGVELLERASRLFIREREAAIHRFEVEMGKFLKEAQVEAEVALLMDETDLSFTFRPVGRARAMRQRIRYAEEQLVTTFRNAVQNGLPSEEQKPMQALVEDLVHRLAASSPFAFDFTGLSVPFWGSPRLFKPALAELFGSYRDKVIENDLRQRKQSRTSTSQGALSDIEFTAAYGDSPWQAANAALAKLNLDFAIEPPDEFSLAKYRPRLKKKSSSAEVDPANLSTGEKILMAMALCVYYSSETRQSVAAPERVLLDEVDAPLHPSMTRDFVSVIKDTLNNQFGAFVIATTHSPSTVAQTPEGALYVLQSDASGHWLEPVSRGKALNILTAGVPNLAVSYDGRRQVFCENEVDARTYGLLYMQMKADLGSERSLDFLETGIKTAQGNKGDGCANVAGIVGQLVASGNRSAFGLIDSDRGANAKHATDRIHIVAGGTRDGIENLLFDPLLLLG